MKQGEIWLINLDPTIGAEIKKTRPALLVSDDNLGKLPLRVIVPITEWKSRYEIAPWMVLLTPNTENKLAKDSAADCFQIRSVSNERFVKRIGSVSTALMDNIKIALSRVLSLER